MSEIYNWIGAARGIGLAVELKGERFTNLRFADDVLLSAKSLEHLIAMLEDLTKAAGKCGFKLHPKKTKILTNIQKRNGRYKDKLAKVGAHQLEILALKASTKYLGYLFSFNDTMGGEIQNRISRGWRKFHIYKDGLCHKQYSLHHRLRLFDTVISPTILDGSSTWTLT